MSLPGHLDIGTTYTSSRIRCNAEVGGHTGYAEFKAAGSWDMFLNLSTTYPNGGCMFFKIKNDGYIQLPGSDSKINIYKDTTISGNLDVGVGAPVTSITAYVNHARHQGNVEIEARWKSQGHINVNTTNAYGLLPIAT